jgi:tRNA dimethylallyltransferase
MQFNDWVDQIQGEKITDRENECQDCGSIVPFLLVVGGATATGKSGLAMALSHRIEAAILSADSRQVYREFDIGTAKASLLERSCAPHYLIDICDPTQTLTLATYQQAAQILISQLHRQGRKLPMLVGGTGLYIDAVVKGLGIPPVPPQVELRSQLADLGQPYCYTLLQAVDPVAAQRIHPNDAVRTQRSLEVFYVIGHPISSLQREHPPAYPVLYIALDCIDSERLRERITRRTHTMIEQGLVAEVEALIAKYGTDLPLMRTLGYAEIGRYLQSEVNLQTAIELIIQHTCQFAKRQRTWFRNRANAIWFDADSPHLIDEVWRQITTFKASLPTRPEGQTAKLDGANL